MRSISQLVKKVAKDFDTIAFVVNDKAYWSHSKNTIYYSTGTDCQAILLHELAHAILQHAEYPRDISLLQMERDAWDYAITTLAPRYNITIDSDTIESHIDTYRDWLHSKSTCPICASTGIEQSKHTYLCLVCDHRWQVNTATSKNLRRRATLATK